MYKRLFLKLLFFKIEIHISQVKPIFHQNAQLLASGNLASPNAKDRTFASPDARIPTCWYLLALPNANVCVIPDAKPQRQPVEYSLRWVHGVRSRVGHVHFIFFVSISFALGSAFPVEYGLKVFVSKAYRLNQQDNKRVNNLNRMESSPPPNGPVLSLSSSAFQLLHGLYFSYFLKEIMCLRVMVLCIPSGLTAQIITLSSRLNL